MYCFNGLLQKVVNVMMFSKNNTNFTGEPLCKSCKFGYKVLNHPDKYGCLWDKTFVYDVGVCKDYENYED